MQRFMFYTALALTLIFAGIWSTSGAFAEKPQWVDSKEKGETHKQAVKNKSQKQTVKNERHNDKKDADRGKSHEKDKGGDQKNRYFNEQKQAFLHKYYSDQFRQGRCPPGLIKKGKRCIPPGHAKKWKKGQQLPREVIFYNLPPKVLVELGPPPPRYRFVRVAQDILLISIGTGMVLDAFEDIGRQLD